MPEDWKDTRGLRECDCDPRYWWREAQRQRCDLAKMYRAGVSRPNVVNTAHACIERALKAIIAQNGDIDARDMKHGLCSLSRKAKVYDKLDERFQRFLVLTSQFHNKSTYPDSSDMLAPWYSDKEYNRLILTALQLYSELLRYRRTGTGSEGGDANGSVGRR